MAGKRRKKYSVVLETTVRFQRTVVVRGHSMVEAEAVAVARHPASHDRLGGWETVSSAVGTSVVNCQEAEADEVVTEER